MKALTICQPYAELIIRGQKPVENRTWKTDYRGPLLIHAGKSHDWLTLDIVRPYGEILRDTTYNIPLSEMAFGAVVGIVEVVGCYSINYLRSYTCDNALRYLLDSEHTHGPFCFVLKNPQRFTSPIPCRGMQGLWDVPELTRRIVTEEMARMQNGQAV